MLAKYRLKNKRPPFGRFESLKVDCRQCNHVLEPDCAYCGFCGRPTRRQWSRTLRTLLARALTLLGTLTFTWWIGQAVLTMYFRTPETHVPNPWLPGVLPLLLVGLLRHPGRISPRPCERHKGQIFCRHCGNRLIANRNPLQLAARIFGELPHAFWLAGAVALTVTAGALILQGAPGKKGLAVLGAGWLGCVFVAYLTRRIVDRISR